MRVTRPDCPRSYTNLAYHNLLDWRLAMDMAALALDPLAPISLSSPRWSRVADIAALMTQNARPGYNQITVADLPAITNGPDVFILAHPLWRTERPALGPELAAAWDEAERVRNLRVSSESFVSVFEATLWSQMRICGLRASLTANPEADRWVLHDLSNGSELLTRRRRVDHPLGCDDAVPRLEARSEA
jgi:hypothetical protein